MAALFAGPESVRVRGERSTFVWTLLTLPISVIVLGWLLQHQVGVQEIALLLVVAMLYVAFARGRLLGGGLRIHAGQFGHIHEVVEQCARMMRMPTPQVFVRDDPFVPVVGIGIGDPYAIVISAQYVDHFQPDELRFLIGRELGHIAAGHTRFTSLLSTNGRENGVISVAFGRWLRTIDYTADRAGLLCCGSLDAAIRAIAVSSFGSVGRKAELGAFAAQLTELQAEPSLRMAEWTSSTPYATNRIAALQQFARDPLYLTWAQRFAAVDTTVPVGEARETIYANFGRRVWAFAIDVVIIQAIVPAAHALQMKLRPGDVQTLNASVPSWAVAAIKGATDGKTFSIVTVGADAMLWVAFGLYVILLVGLVGQTVGMMVSDLRVVRVNRDTRVGIGNAVGRYLCMIASFALLLGWIGLFRRIQPFEKWSRTRLISGSAAVRS